MISTFLKFLLGIVLALFVGTVFYFSDIGPGQEKQSANLELDNQPKETPDAIETDADGKEPSDNADELIESTFYFRSASELRDAIDANRLKAETAGQSGTATLFATIQFAHDDDAISESDQDQLSTLVDVVTAAGAEAAGVTIVAHASTSEVPEPTDEFQDATDLSTSRGTMLQNTFILVYGLESDRTVAVGRGATEALPDVDGADRRQQRAEIYVTVPTRIADAGEDETLADPSWIAPPSRLEDALTWGFDREENGEITPVDAVKNGDFWDLPSRVREGWGTPATYVSAQDYGALKFAQEPHVIQFQPGWEIEDQATLIAWIQPKWDDETLPGFDPVIASATSIGSTQFVLSMREDRTGLSLWNGDPDVEPDTIDYDFTLAIPRHVALVFDFDQTVLLIDGVFIGRFDMGLSDQSASKMTLGAQTTEAVLEATQTNHFTGTIAGVRFFGRSLTPEEVVFVRQYDRDISGTSMFADQVFYTAQIKRDFRSFTFPPHHAVPQSMWMVYGSDTITMQNRDEVYQSGINLNDPKKIDKDDKNFVRPHIQSHHVDLVSKEHPDPQGVFSTYPIYKIESFPGTQVGDPLLHGATTTELETRPFDMSRPNRKMSHLHLIGDGAFLFGIEMEFEGGGEIGVGLRDRSKFGNTVSFDIRPDEHVVGIRGEYVSGGSDIYQGITDFVVLTDKRELHYNARHQPDAKSFQEWIPEGYDFTGLLGTIATKDIANGVTSKPIMSVGLRPIRQLGRKSLLVSREDGVVSRFVQYGQSNSNIYRSVRKANAFHAEKNVFLEVKHDGLIRVEGIDHDIVPVPERATPRDARDTFEDIFVVQSKAVNLASNYKTYDMTKMDPIHLTETGTSKRVFAMPKPGSSDFYDANRLFIPRGLIYVPEFTGESSVQTHAISNMSEYNKATSQNYGGSFGIAGNALNVSYTHKKARRTLRSGEKSMTISFAKNVMYDLVLDKAHMQLDPDFIARVRRLVDQGTDADYQTFIDTFGTHYPYAVVYGGMGVMQMEFEKTVFEKSTSDTKELTVGAHRGARSNKDANGATQHRMLTGGANAAFSSSTGSSTRKEVTDQLDNFYWVGGAHAGSSRESWGVGLEGVVPVYVQLGQLDELLGPPFFDDRRVTTLVKGKMKAAIDGYLQDAVLRAKQDAERRVRVQVLLTRMWVKDRETLEDDDVWELSGSILSTNLFPGRASMHKRFFQEHVFRSLSTGSTPDELVKGDNRTFWSRPRKSPKDLDVTKDFAFGDIITGNRTQTFDVVPYQFEDTAPKEKNGVNIAVRLREEDSFIDEDEYFVGNFDIPWQDFPERVGETITKTFEVKEAGYAWRDGETLKIQVALKRVGEVFIAEEGQ